MSRTMATTIPEASTSSNKISEETLVDTSTEVTPWITIVVSVPITTRMLLEE
jgi:hypothetical protein